MEQGEVIKNGKQILSCDKIIEFAQKLKKTIETDYGKQIFYDPTKPIEEQETETIDLGLSPSAKIYMECLKSHLPILDTYIEDRLK